MKPKRQLQIRDCGKTHSELEKYSAVNNTQLEPLLPRWLVHTFIFATRVGD
jgi:hypothetical protein